MSAAGDSVKSEGFGCKWQLHPCEFSDLNFQAGLKALLLEVSEHKSPVPFQH